MAERGPVGFAVVGLGHIAQTAVLPAFEHAAPHARLVGLVSGDEAKRRELSRRHGVRAWSYEALDECLADPGVEAVYVALPNTMHEECAIRAARAGVHVLCEKPLATSSAACEAMIRAAADADVRLMTAYRLHFEPANLSTIALVLAGELGDPRFFSSEFSYQVRPGNIRTRADLGGGALWDLGVYCVNAARYLFRDEPEEAFATATPPSDDRFHGVDEAWACLLRFPGDRPASFTVSFNAAATSRYRLVGTRGSVQLEPAYEYQGELVRHVTVGEETRTDRFGPGDQFAPELIRFAECVRSGAEPEPSGREGLADVRVIEALLESARAHRPIRIAPVTQAALPDERQELRAPPVEEPEPVHAQAPPQGS
jgi:predicted dehydrogenase